MSRIPERDWRIWKPLFDVALERFCERTLERAASYAEDDGTAHERYLRLYRYVEQRDKELGSVCDGFSRSRAILQIALAFKKKLITPEELAQFSEETHAVVSALLGSPIRPGQGTA